MASEEVLFGLNTQQKKSIMDYVETYVAEHGGGTPGENVNAVLQFSFSEPTELPLDQFMDIYGILSYMVDEYTLGATPVPLEDSVNTTVTIEPEGFFVLGPVVGYNREVQPIAEGSSLITLTHTYQGVEFVAARHLNIGPPAG